MTIMIAPKIVRHRFEDGATCIAPFDLDVEEDDGTAEVVWVTPTGPSPVRICVGEAVAENNLCKKSAPNTLALCG